MIRFKYVQLSYLTFFITAAGVSSISYGQTVTFKEVGEQVFSKYCTDCHGSPDPTANLDLRSYASIMSQGVVVPKDAEASLLYQKVVTGEMPEGGDPLTVDELILVRDWINSGALDAQPVGELSITSVTPSFGPTTGGTEIVIRGEFLSDVESVIIDGVLCTALTLVDATTLKCTTPAHTTGGSVSIAVVSGDKKSKLENAFQYRLPLGPSYQSIFSNILKPKCLGCHNNENPSHDLSVESYASLMSHRRAVIPGDSKKSRLYKKTKEGEMPRGGERLSSLELAAIKTWIEIGAAND